MRVYEAKIVYNLVSPGEAIQLNSTDKVVQYLQSAYEEYPLQEAFYVIYLNRRLYPIGRHMVSLGSLTATIVSPREVFRGAILAGAASIIVSHNHPSGDPAPSQADLCVTRTLREAARVIEIDLLDHVIVGNKAVDPAGLGWYSFRADGIL